MEPLTGLEDDDDFFGSYAAEQASELEFDETEPHAPTEEQLAHRGRFRRPVAAVVAGMALLSIVALGTRGARQPSFERELVAHYGAALVPPTESASTSTALQQPAFAPRASSTRSSEPSNALVPDALSSFVNDALSVFVPEASIPTNLAPSARTGSALATARKPAASDTALPTLFTQGDSRSVGAFLSALTQTCLQHVGSESTDSLQRSFTIDRFTR